jgi:hypothetical protein
MKKLKEYSTKFLRIRRIVSLFLKKPKIQKDFLDVFKQQILDLEIENHNIFGEKIGRLKIKIRGKIGIKAHLKKEIPQITLINFDKEIERPLFFENFLNLEQINQKERLSRLLHINKNDIILRNFYILPKNISNLLKKKKKIVRKILQKIPTYNIKEPAKNPNIIKQKLYIEKVLKTINHKLTERNLLKRLNELKEKKFIIINNEDEENFTKIEKIIINNSDSEEDKLEEEKIEKEIEKQKKKSEKNI